MLESIGAAVEGVATPPQAETTNQTTEVTEGAPEGSTTTEAATEAPDSFTKLDPNSLPEEVRPYYDSMLGDYTRKTQEAAPWRKLGEELGVSSPDEFRQAAELFAYLQDDNNARQFAQQLAQAYGITGQAPAPATEAAEPTTTADEFAALDDPAVQQLRAEIDGLKQAVAQRDQQAQQEAMQWHLLGEMNRQEAMLKEQHPTWAEDGEEWTAIWNMAPQFGGDLTVPAQIIEQAQQAAVVRLLNGKATVAETEGLTPAAPPRVAATPIERGAADDPELRNETAQALEFLRGVVNQSE